MKIFHINIGRLLTLAFLAFGMVNVSFAADAKPGNIKVLDVKGDVSQKLTTDGAPQPLVKNTFIQQGQVIKTGKGAKALLLMSNGTTISIDQNTSFRVDKFTQTPFDSSNISYRDSKTEPSRSHTLIFITEGSIVAQVAKLLKGSTFKIGTPAGVAEVHGTLIQVTVNTTAGGSVSVTVNLPQGLSDFAATNGQQVTLSNGQTITVSSNPVTGTMTISNVSPLAAQTMQQILSLAEQVASAIPATATFEGVPAGAPEQLGAALPPPDQSGTTPGSDQSAGPVGGTGGNGTTIILPPIGTLYSDQN